MARSNVFDNPVIGEHTPLSLRWTPEQLVVIIELLVPRLPARITQRMVRAVASVARSVALAHKQTGDGVHYSRKTDFYNKPKRYRCGDLLHTHHFVTTAMKDLEELGLITTAPGIWRKYGSGYQSVVWATDDLLALIGDLVDVDEERGIPEQSETVIPRNEAKQDIDYDDDETTVRMREELVLINHYLSKCELLRSGERVGIPIGRRVFNVTFDRGGRFYLFGESFQMIPSRVRPTLELVVYGQRRPVVEVDYASLHPTMDYAEAGVPAPDGDLYKIDGFHREFVKRGVNVLLNAKLSLNPWTVGL